MLLVKTVSFKAAPRHPASAACRVLRERAKVQLIPDEALKQFLPVRVAHVEISLRDGSRFSERVEAVRGTPRNPMSRAEVIAKCRDLIAPVLGPDTAARLIDTVFKIESVTDIRQLQPMLQRS